MISYHDENLCHTCCIICIPVLVVMMQKNHHLKFDIAIFSSIKLNMMFGTTRTTACRDPRYLTHITHFYDDLAPISIFTLGSIYDNGWHWLKCRKLNFVSWRISAWPSRKFDGHHPRIGLITAFLHFCWSTSTLSI
jgi:hypothetical protein